MLSVLPGAVHFWPRFLRVLEGERDWRAMTSDFRIFFLRATILESFLRAEPPSAAIIALQGRELQSPRLAQIPRLFACWKCASAERRREGQNSNHLWVQELKKGENFSNFRPTARSDAVRRSLATPQGGVARCPYGHTTSGFAIHAIPPPGHGCGRWPAGGAARSGR